MPEVLKPVSTDDQDTNQYDPHTIPGYNYLEALHPDVAKCLIYDHDRTDNRSIEMCDWKCPDCQGVYTAFIQDIIFYAEKGKNTCPYCNETQVLPAYNSLKARHPEVAKLWSPRNRKAADQVLPKSTEQALWICSDCYNEYDATILSMTSGEMQCPYCTGWRTLPGVDSFSVNGIKGERVKFILSQLQNSSGTVLSATANLNQLYKA